MKIGRTNASGGGSIEHNDTLNQNSNPNFLHINEEEKSLITSTAGIVSEHTGDIELLKENKANKATMLSGYGIEDAYTKTEIDNKISAVFRYKGSVPTYADLIVLTEMIVGDVYNVTDTGDNYAWTGTLWDKLSGEIDLTAYLTKNEALITYETIENVQTLNDTVSGHTGDIESLEANKANTSHTHTKSEVGLSNVDNTSDANKPVSTATQTALNGKANTVHTHTKSEVGLANVDNTSDLLKPISTATQSALNSKANTSHTHTKSEVGLSNVDNTSDLTKPISTATQTALNSKANTSHTHTKSEVGLANVDNTSDVNKPVSNATQTALNSKANTSHTHTKSEVGLANVDNTTDLLKPISNATQGALDGKMNTGAAITDAQLPGRLQEQSSRITDWNTATTNGFYQSGPAATNVPVGGKYILGQVWNHDTTGNCTQEVHVFVGDSSTNTQSYRRDMNGGTWGAWYKVLKSQEEIVAAISATNVSESQLPERIRTVAQRIHNWNTTTETGWYQSYSNSEATRVELNAPVEGWLLGHVVAHISAPASAYCTQEVWQFSNGIGMKWKRTIRNGVPDANWIQVYETASELNSVSLPLLGKPSGELQLGRNYYNVASFVSGGGAAVDEVVIYTRLTYNSNNMPVIKINGYCYIGGSGKASNIDLQIMYYVAGGNIVNDGVVSNGTFTPTVKLFKHTVSGTDYIAVGLQGLISYLQFTVDYQNHWSASNQSAGWTVASQNGGTSLIEGKPNLKTITYNLGNKTDISGKEDSINKVTTLTNNDTDYPTTKAVTDAITTLPITWSALKSLRDAGTLVPGQSYRITDYVCTTTTTDSQAANNLFDIIVTALDASHLSENASATYHEGDTYFSSNNAKLEAWEIKYCIDNDTTRFEWADTVNGKGVIYYMKDEWNNECPYDFKNIRFKKNNVWLYTFGGAVDNSVVSYYNDDYEAYFYCTNNIIGVYSEKNNQILKYKLSFNTFGVNSYSNMFGVNCYSNTFGRLCFSNTFGNSCSRITFGNSCSRITFGNSCDSNTFGDSCWSNTFGDYCYNNTFGNTCYYNTFGNNCYYNTFGNNCYSNTFGDSCWSNTFGDYCYNNTFGSDCNSNTFGNNCNSNTFGDSCDSNTFGNNCYYNTFGNNCYSNTFGNYCYSNTFGNYCGANNFYAGTSGTTKKDYIKYIVLEDGCRYNNFYSTLTTSASSYLQRIRIKGLDNTAPTNIQITLSAVNTKYEWVICYTSGNVLKQYCPEDLVP